MSAALRWPRRLAHAVPLLVLPSAVWRIAFVAGLPVAGIPVGGGLEHVYVIALVLVSEGAALLTLGLVQPWGEVVPRWIPLLGGRAVRPMAAFLPAVTGAAALVVVWGWVFWGMATTDFFEHFDSTAQRLLVTSCYLPLLAWGPLLAAVAIAYRRRRAHDTSAGSGTTHGS